MTRDDIIRMAQESQLITRDGSSVFISGADLRPVVLRFAALVAAAERERCAVLLDQVSARLQEKPCHGVDGMVGSVIAGCAADIRAMESA